jgi:hypothetical protein
MMNKFLHAPLQALKTAARQGDVAKVDAIREGFEGVSERPSAQVPSAQDASEKAPAPAEPATVEDSDVVTPLRSGRS